MLFKGCGPSVVSFFSTVRSMIAFVRVLWVRSPVKMAKRMVFYFSLAVGVFLVNSPLVILL